jgi:hypothetical protein
MKKKTLLFSVVLLLAISSLCFSVESGMYRLLSISDSEKLILVSQIPNKAKFLLDASTAKITVNGKAAEFRELKIFSIIQVKADIKKSSRNGSDIDGTASEIKISIPERPK